MQSFSSYIMEKLHINKDMKKFSVPEDALTKNYRLLISIKDASYDRLETLYGGFFVDPEDHDNKPGYIVPKKEADEMYNNFGDVLDCILPYEKYEYLEDFILAYTNGDFKYRELNIIL